MRAVNKKAEKVLDKLTAGLGTGQARTIDNAEGTFMAVHVECLTGCSLGPRYSIAHYYVQNGDMMADPEMVFIKGADDRYYPEHYQQDGLGIFQRAVYIEKGFSFHPRLQKDLAIFTSTWMKNIKQQQNL